MKFHKKKHFQQAFGRSLTIYTGALLKMLFFLCCNYGFNILSSHPVYLKQVQAVFLCFFQRNCFSLE